MMTKIKLTTLAFALAAAALSSTGCGKQEIKQLTAQLRMEQDRSRTLEAQRDSAQQQLAAAQSRSTDIGAQLNAKDLEIESAKSERDKAISDLDALKKERAAAPPATAGWKAGTIGAEISIGSDVLFSSGRATLTSGGKRALSSIASSILSNHAGKNIRIYGHTDSDPIRKSKKLWADNLDLSANRAMAVTRYLISRGVKGSLIESIGMGSTRPIAGNKSAADKKKNRRVEIMIIN
ncbi:MAG: OmpA family protein [Phycisphaerae bacterium]|jgi:flagellar motor protein MotB|nr:OmpA family protein [Phycisphaerae bacterium]